MKKLFLALVLCLFTSTAFCGAPTCRVYGTNGVVATICYTNDQTDEIGPRFEVQVAITKAQTEDVSVVVEATQDGNFVGSVVVPIYAGATRSERGIIFLNNNYNKNGGRVNINIASASCQ